MVPFRVLVRLKIFQLGGVAALAIPINTFLVEVPCRGLSKGSSYLHALDHFLLPPALAFEDNLQLCLFKVSPQSTLFIVWACLIHNHKCKL